MRRFKLKQGNARPYDISRREFERLTGGEEPYTEMSKDEQKRQFGICPACDNPIQLLGLYKRLKNTDNPYGRHYNRDANIAAYNEQAYRYCPYASHIYNSSEKELKPELTDFEKSIYYTLRENFDLAIYLLSQISGLKVNDELAACILQEYLAGKGYMYYGATLYNIPWMLLYFFGAKTCYGRIVRKESSLYKMLEKREDVLLVQLYDSQWYQIKGNGSWLDLDFSTLFHKRHIVSNEVREEIHMVLLSRDDGELPGRDDDVCLEINEYRFPNLIHSEKARQYRNIQLLQIAQNLMPDLE